MKAYKIITFMLFMCVANSLSGSFKLFRSEGLSGADKGIAFRFTDEGFKLDTFLVDACRLKSDVFEGSFALYCKDLYAGKISDYEEEIKSASQCVEYIRVGIQGMPEDKRKKAVSLWNDIIVKKVYPLVGTLRRFANVKMILKQETFCETNWDNYFLHRGLSGTTKDRFFKRGYFGNVETFVKSIREQSFVPLSHSPHIFMNVYLTRLFQGEIENPEQELDGIDQAIKVLSAENRPILHKSTFCTCCDRMYPGVVNVEPVTNHIYMASVPVIPELEKLKDILEEYHTVYKTVESQLR